MERSVGALVVLSTCLLLARRLRALAPARRRVLAPLSVYGIVAVLFIPVTSALGDVFGNPLAQAAVQLSRSQATKMDVRQSSGEVRELAPPQVVHPMTAESSRRTAAVGDQRGGPRGDHPAAEPTAPAVTLIGAARPMARVYGRSTRAAA